MPSQSRCGTEAFWITATQNERLLRDPATGCAIGRSSMWEGAALSQSHSFGTEGWWDLSFNVRRRRQRPRQAWLRAGCRHLSPPTLSESSYTYLLRSTALRVLTRQSPNTPCRGRAGRETSLEGRRALGRALTSPTPLFYSGSSRLTQNQWWLQQLLFSRSPKPPGTRAWGHTAIGTLCLQGPTSGERFV